MTDHPVDVVHVGFSKCASTFLRAFILDHPQTHLVSEAHYFVPFEHCNYERGAPFYRSQFRDAEPGQLRVESDEHIVLPLLHPVLRAASTTLESVTEALDRVMETAPRAKIILIVRNQLDLLLSRYGEYVMSGRDIDFEAFVEEMLCCRTDGVNYYQNYYARIIDLLHRRFAPDRVLVLLQEDLNRNEDEIVERLCHFLEIRVRKFRDEQNTGTRGLFSLDFARVVARSGKYSKNTGLSRTGIGAMRLWNRIVVREGEEAWYQKARSWLPYLVYKFGVRALRVSDYYLPKRLKGDKRGLISERIANRIRDEFREDNERLAGLLGRDLRPLGY